MSTARSYHIHETIGKGAFGVVYRATLKDRGGLTKEVAVKVLSKTGPSADDDARRLRDEARLLGFIRHRAIVQVEALMQIDERWTVVTEFVSGVNALNLVKSQPLPVACGLEVIGEVAAALHSAYHGKSPEGGQLKLVHRDIKPSNIQITETGEVKLLDFGIATAEFEDREAKTKGIVLGSPGYMAPERMYMDSGPWGDVYSLAVVYCEIVTGKKFGKTMADPVRHAKHVNTILPKLAQYAGEGFAAVEPLLKRMLSYDPDTRPTAKEVERECQQLRSQLQGMWLSELAEKHIPELVKNGPTWPDDPLNGQILNADGQPIDAASLTPANGSSLTDVNTVQTEQSAQTRVYTAIAVGAITIGAIVFLLGVAALIIVSTQ